MAELKADWCSVGRWPAGDCSMKPMNSCASFGSCSCSENGKDVDALVPACFGAALAQACHAENSAWGCAYAFGHASIACAGHFHPPLGQQKNFEIDWVLVRTERSSACLT